MAETYDSSNTNSTTTGENLIASQFSSPIGELGPQDFDAQEPPIDELLDPLLLGGELPFSPPDPPTRPNRVSIGELAQQQNQVSFGELDPLTGEQVHRFWDEQTQGHFFTASQSEFSDRQSNSARYRYEGVEFNVPSRTDSQALPVYRFLNDLTGNYFYTLQEPDAITGEFSALESEGVAFYAFSPNGAVPAGAVPVYRFFNESASARAGSPVHFFTASEENKDNVMANEPGFTFEGIGWYALDPDGIATTQGGGSTSTGGGSTGGGLTFEPGGGSTGGGVSTSPDGGSTSGGVTTSPGGGSSSGGLDDLGSDDSFGLGDDDFGAGF